MSVRNRILLALGALLLPLAVCEAGIVVLERGDVIVGEIDQRSVPGRVVVRWKKPDEGRMEIDLEDVRWLDPESDVLTDRYFEDHEPAHLKGARWLAQREAWRAAKSRIDDPPLPLPPISLDPLDLEPTGNGVFQLRKPRGWTASWVRGEQTTSQADEVLVFRAPAAAERAFRPRVHAFAVSAPQASVGPREQVRWLQDELRRIGSDSKQIETFGLRGELRLDVKTKSEADARFETLTVLAPAAGGQRIVALRRVAFRDHHTIVLAGYAAERDLPALRALFEASFASLRVGPQE